MVLENENYWAGKGRDVGKKGRRLATPTKTQKAIFFREFGKSAGGGKGDGGVLSVCTITKLRVPGGGVDNENACEKRKFRGGVQKVPTANVCWG